MQPEAILIYFAKFIEKELGIVYATHNYFQLQNRLEEICKLIDVENLSALYDLAQKGIKGQFRQLLLDLATNNETSFFRDPKIFKAIENTVLSAFQEKNSGKLQIWSAASSTGQEALSVSILIKEWSEKRAVNLPFSITGTDISERVLARAKSAQYSQLEVQRGLPAPYLIKYFKKDEQDRWTAKSELTSHTEFTKLNLKEPFRHTSPFFLVLCRNVLIYQNVESKKEILQRISKEIMPGGFLILGAGESLIGLSSDFEQTSFEGAVFYRKKIQAERKAA